MFLSMRFIFSLVKVFTLKTSDGPKVYFLTKYQTKCDKCYVDVIVVVPDFILCWFLFSFNEMSSLLTVYFQSFQLLASKTLIII